MVFFALFLALLTLNLGFAVYFFLVPLILSANRLKGLKEILATAVVLALLTSILMFRWVWDYDSEYFYLVILSLLGFFSLLVGGISLIQHKLTMIWRIQLVPLSWLALMALFSLLPAEAFWLDIALFQPLAAPLIGILGSAGVTYLIVLNNVLWAESLRSWNQTVTVSAVFTLTMLIVCWVYSANSTVENKTQRVALVQGNFSIDWQWRQLAASSTIFDEYSKLSRQAVRHDPDLIVWPEYAIPVDFVNHSARLRQRLTDLSTELSTPLVVGSMVVDGNSDDHFDSAIVMNKGKLVAQYHSKFPAFFNQNTVAGRQALKAFNHPNNDFLYGIVICFEETMSRLFREYAKLGTRLLISIANNQDLGLGRDLASKYGQLRAAESSTYLVRASNDGNTISV
ncbi:MAG: hypothetical protein MK188_12105, partial [Gammaproteobacteria bacterium]|nr:hypothetical protein [Gammaproteobacteria bacterium]